jgi:hypothetical protein
MILKDLHQVKIHQAQRSNAVQANASGSHHENNGPNGETSGDTEARLVEYQEELSMVLRAAVLATGVCRLMRYCKALYTPDHLNEVASELEWHTKHVQQCLLGMSPGRLW